MTDHYGDAITAGAAALAKPYREPETIRAFTDEYPTLAAARVLDAALPHMRAAIIAEGIAPGPCPAWKEFGHEGIFSVGNPKPRTLRALCDLRAGHAGQHEAEDEQWGHFRWTDEAEPRRGCTSVLRDEGHQQCVRVSGHRGYHVGEGLVWNDLCTVVAR
jgi:hypothetical protein